MDTLWGDYRDHFNKVEETRPENKVCPAKRLILENPRPDHYHHHHRHHHRHHHLNMDTLWGDYRDYFNKVEETRPENKVQTGVAILAPE
jgi:hypothetical protein